MEVDSHMDNPWPVLKDTMRVLALGNSYTDDATSYLPVFLADSDIDGEKVCVYMGARAAASLQTWNDLFDINSVVKLSLKAGKLQMPVVEAPCMRYSRKIGMLSYYSNKVIWRLTIQVIILI